MSLPESLVELPVEVLTNIAKRLDAVALSKLGQTSRTAYSTATEPELWKSLCLERNCHIRIDYWNYDWRKAYTSYMHKVPSQVDKLLVLDSAYQLQLWEGKDFPRVAIPNAVQEEFGGTQPTWSWDCRFVASAVGQQHRDTITYGIQVVDLTTQRCVVFPTARMAFFISWHPDCTRLTYLSAVTQPMLAVIDILPKFDESTELATAPAPLLPEPSDSSTLLHEGLGLYYSFCPIPGADRILTNVPTTVLSIVGLNSRACIPLTFRGADGMDQRRPPTSRSAPPHFITSDLVEQPDSLAGASLGLFSYPCWTSCNTMVISLKTTPDTNVVVAFDACWNPKYEHRNMVDVWRTEGVAGVKKLLGAHTMEKDTEDGTFALPPQAAVLELFRTTSRCSFITSPNGRYVACYTAQELVVVELVYSDASTSHITSSGTFFSDFTPKRLAGSKVVVKLPLTVIGATFAPNNKTLLILTRYNVLYRWSTIQIGAELTPKVTNYKEFVQAAFLIRHYILFFPQYTQSMQMFSPDSTHFCYPADAKIWVQEVAIDADTGNPPEQVCNGIYCAWSPR